MERVLIIGGSIAAVRTAQFLRSGGMEGEVTIVSADLSPLYDRPPLSKRLLSGSASEQASKLLSSGDADDLQLRLIEGHSAVALDVEQKIVTLDDGRQLAYESLVIATGSVARVPDWARIEGVHTLRTLPEARALQQSLGVSDSLAVIGAGFIGCEVASIACQRGLKVAILDPLDYPMARAFDATVGEWFRELHERHGVTMSLGTSVSRIEKRDRGFTVSAEDGRAFQADTVLVGVGAIPNTSWLESSRLTIQDGVCCDEYGRAMGVQDVFAVGDVARWAVSIGDSSVRYEHWTSAVDEAICVAHNICHPTELRANAAAPYVWTDQYDWKAQIIGDPRGARGTMLGNPLERGKAAALYADDDGNFTGAVTINWPRALIACRRAASASGPVDAILEQLIHEDVGLRA